MRKLLQRFRRFLRELKRRKVYRVAAAYVVVALGLWQAAAVAAPALKLPSWTVSLVVLLTLFGFPVALVLAWGWELTPEGVRRTPPGSGGEVQVAVPRGSRRREATGGKGILGRHPGAVTVGIAVGLLTVVTFGVWTALRSPDLPPPPDDGRLGVAIFPFRSAGPSADPWVEGAPDLLAMALEGTAGLRVVDPWGLWRPLRGGSSDRARVPEQDQAASLAGEAGAHRYVLGSVVPGSGETHLTLRVYSVYREEPLESLRVDAAGAGDIGGAVRRAALRLLPVLAREAGDVGVGSDLRFAVTDSPRALQAYLAAREAMRRGMFDSAEVAVDRALSLDSAFVLANLTAFSVKSWVQFLEGTPYSGLERYVERAEAHAGDAKASTRLRLDAARAQLETDGATCAGAARELVREDSADILAWSDLRYCHLVYGWQYGADPADVRRASDRIVELDSTFVPELVSRAMLSASVGSAEETDRWLARLGTVGSNAPVVRGTVLALRAARTDASSLDSLVDRAGAAPDEVWTQAFRILRTRWPERAGELLRARLEATPPGDRAFAARGGALRLPMARGRPSHVDSMLREGGLPGMETVARRWLVAADLAGLGDRSRARRAVAALSARVPADSAAAMFGRAMVWQIGWTVAAHHALWGDTTVTRRWRTALGELPAGGTPRDYRGSLQADLDARLALRRADSTSALRHVREAYRLWGIHPNTTFEADPEPAMRFLLGRLHLAAGHRDSARAMFRSLVPPATWMGFLTTRARLELGELARRAGRPERAVRFLEPAVRYLEGSDPGVAERWLPGARRALAEAREQI